MDVANVSTVKAEHSTTRHFQLPPSAMPKPNGTTNIQSPLTHDLTFFVSATYVQNTAKTIDAIAPATSLLSLPILIRMSFAASSAAKL